MGSRDYTSVEMMACALSRMIEDNKIVFVGTGLPMVASVLAKLSTAPNITILFQAGSGNPELRQLPTSVADSRTHRRCTFLTEMCDFFECAQAGFVDYGFLGGAQIDPYGNLNATVIGGDYFRPNVRYGGAGGAPEIASLCWKTIIIMQHEKRRFVEKLDFLSTPGYLTGPGAREEAGLPPGTGPYRVVTALAVMDFEPRSKRMRVIGLMPGVTPEKVQENTGFELLVADNLVELDPPTSEELRLLREKVDPEGLWLKRPAE
ncbi:MAG: hypothetical protein H5U03_05895 [Clostridia bacterium]|nr:hypothetical protein [Clostridia bacterium]